MATHLTYEVPTTMLAQTIAVPVRKLPRTMKQNLPNPDVEVIRRAVAGDREAFSSLVRHFWGRLHRWLRGLTGSNAAAEDLTQEAFLRAWQGLATFRPGADFRTWLFGIARHAWIDTRKGPRGKRFERLSDEQAGREPSPQQAAEENELQARFGQALARLPEHFRAPFLLWSHEGLSFAAIGSVCAITESTARWRVFKARHLLVQLLCDIRGEIVP